MPGYLAHLAVHRPSRTGVVAFANAYGFRQGSISELGRRRADGRCSTASRSCPSRGARPARPADRWPPLTGRWWWMGREYDRAWDDATRELVLSQLRTGAPKATPVRPEGTDRWRGRGGPNDGEVLRSAATTRHAGARWTSPRSSSPDTLTGSG